jgi:hypothetical protein
MAMKVVKKKRIEDDHRDSPRFEVPLYIRNNQGVYVERYGRLGIGGFYFETDEVPLVGQLIEVKLVLLGLGTEVETQGRVINVEPSASYMRVAVRFEDISFHTERMIARWLDLLAHAHQVTARAG